MKRALKIKIGTVGPEDSVTLLMEQMKQYEEFEAVPFCYSHTEELVDHLQSANSEISYWLFSGQAPYDMAITHQLIDPRHASFPPLYGASLLGRLVEAQYTEQSLFQSISLDTIQENEVNQVKAEFLPEGLAVHTLSYDGFKASDELVSFHKKLYEQKQTEVAFTCRREVYIELQKLDIPCYRVTPTRLSIELTLKYIKERAQSMVYQKAQIAIVAIEVVNRLNKKNPSYYSIKSKYQELDLKRWLLHYAEKVGGSYMQIGDGTFFIYTTRGELEWHGDALWFQFMQDAKSNTGLETNVVVGYGKTAMESEGNARSALRDVQEHQSGVIIHVDEDKRRTEHQPDEAALSYETRRMDDQYSTDMTLSPAIINKIRSLSRYYDRDLITAQDLSQWLNSSIRNANRILTKLEEMQIATKSGEEQSGRRGRPRKVYRLKME